MKKVYTNKDGQTPTTYYVNTIPNPKATERELVEQGMCLYNAKYADSDTLAFLGYMDKIVQPKHEVIASALLWGYEDYAIKVGSYGGFVSSLSITIDSNGTDKDVVLIKKWGKRLEDVYITYNDIEEVYKQCETDAQRTDRVEGEICAVIKEYVRRVLTNKPNKLYKEYLLNNPKETLKVLPKFFKLVEKDINNYENYETVFVNSHLTNKEHWEAQLHTSKKRLAILTELRDFLQNI